MSGLPTHEQLCENGLLTGGRFFSYFVTRDRTRTAYRRAATLHGQHEAPYYFRNR